MAKLNNCDSFAQGTNEDSFFLRKKLSLQNSQVLWGPQNLLDFDWSEKKSIAQVKHFSASDFFQQEKRAQGTIEYLVIVATVVVIALIAVGLFITLSSSPSQQVIDSSSKIGDVAVGGISIVESVVDPDGNSLIFLVNNSSDAITLKKISVGDVDNNYNNLIVGLDPNVISLSGLGSACPCVGSQKSVTCNFKFEYETSTGITKIEYRTINVQCVSNARATNENRAVNPIVIEVVLEDGTLAHPWIINNCIELQDMNQHLTENFVLGNDVNCSDTINWGVNGFIPIGSIVHCVEGDCQVENPFRGTLDGNNYKITNLYIRAGAYGGLFGYIHTGIVSNVDLENVDISCEGSTNSPGCGGIAGAFSGVLNNVYVTGDISGSATFIGGLVGYVNEDNGEEINEIIDSHFDGVLTSISDSCDVGGGLVGSPGYLNINNSSTAGSILGKFNAGTPGQFIGITGEVSITNSSSTIVAPVCSGSDFLCEAFADFESCSQYDNHAGDCSWVSNGYCFNNNHEESFCESYSEEQCASNSADCYWEIVNAVCNGTFSCLDQNANINFCEVASSSNCTIN